MTSLRNISIFSFIFIIVLALSGEISNAQTTFPDIQGHAYQESIEALAADDIIQGYPNGNFGPDDFLDRAQMVTLMMRSLYPESIDPDARNCFIDVFSQWFAQYVCPALELGIIDGNDDGTFAGGRFLNSAEAYKIIIESFEFPLESSGEGEWYTPYVEMIHDHNLFSKYNRLPSKQVTRAEVAYLIHQFKKHQDGTEPLAKGRQNWSTGCGQAPPSVVPSTSMVNGVERHYITVIPNGYDPSVPTKIVFAFHGRTNSNEEVRGYYKVEEAAGDNAIFVYPSGLPTFSSPRTWSDGGDSASNLRDYAFFDQLLDEFSNNYCIDLDHVYAVAHSLGAWFTNSLACHRGHILRGVGTLGGGTSIGDCTGPVATMILHNPSDRLAPFSSGEQARDQYIRQNACNANSVPTEPSAGNCVAYQGCYSETPLIWCPHTEDYSWGSYYPHGWPKFTGPEMWKFFESLW